MIKKFRTARIILLLLAVAAVPGFTEISLASTIDFVGNDEVELTLSCDTYHRIELYRNGELVRSCDQGPIKYRDTVAESNAYTYTEKYFSYDKNGQLVSSGVADLGTVTAGEVWGAISSNRTLIDTTWNLSKNLTIPAGVTLTLDQGSALKLHPNSYGAGVLLGGALAAGNAQLAVGITANGANEFTSLNVADSTIDNVAIGGAMTISITNSQTKGYFSIGNSIDSAPVARLQDFSMNSGPSAGWINAIASEGMNVKGNSFPGISVKLNFASSSNAASSPVTIEDNVFGLATLEGTVIGPYPALVKIQDNTVGELTVKHGLGQVLVEGNKGKRIAVFRDGSIDPAVPPPVFDDYQVIVRSNSLANNNTIGIRCFSALSIGGDPANANTASPYSETGVYRVEANGIDTAGACPYSGQFNNGIALLGGASNNLIAGNSVKGGDTGIWLNGVSETTGNLITGNVLHDSNYGIRMTGQVRNNTVEKSAIYNMKYGGFRLVGNSSQGVLVEGNIFKENELENNWNNIGMDYGVKDNHFYNNSFKTPLYRQVEVTNNKVCTDANSILIYCPNNWYEEKTAGTNIIGGPYMGGNYWGTSYPGIDVDSDGLGDTLFSPFSILTPDPGKDLYPLVYELTVNRTGDQPDADLNDGRCDVDLNASGDQCTLRAAIEEANKRPGRQIIAFAISSTGIPVITPLSPLPPIIDDVELRASTQTAGWVELNGSQAGISVSGLVINAAQSSIGNMIIRNFSEDGINAAQYLDLTDIKAMANGGFGVRAYQDIAVHLADNVFSGNGKAGLYSTLGSIAAGDAVIQAENNGWFGILTEQGGVIINWVAGNPAYPFQISHVNNNGKTGIRVIRDPNYIPDELNPDPTGYLTAMFLEVKGNGTAGIDGENGGIRADRGVNLTSTQVSANGGFGVWAFEDISVHLADNVFSGNGKAGLYSTRGSIAAGDAVIQAENNGWYGILAERGSVMINSNALSALPAYPDQISRISHNGKNGIMLSFQTTDESVGSLSASLIEVVGNAGVGISTARNLSLKDSKVCDNRSGNLAVRGTKILVNVDFCDGDLDGISDSIENQAANNGDGNSDGLPDSQQTNVASLLTPGGGNITIFSKLNDGDPNVEPPLIEDVHIGSYKTGNYQPPLIELIQSDSYPPSDSEKFVPEGLIGFKIKRNTGGNGTLGSQTYAYPAAVDTFTTTIFLPAGMAVRKYLAYGPTADNAAFHWYEFLFDSATGAEILPDRIILHFIDGGRGDDDLTVNGVIVHNGGPGEFRFNELADILVVLKVLAGREVQTSYALSAMDMDGDGKIGIEDALYILQVVSAVRD